MVRAVVPVATAQVELGELTDRRHRLGAGQGEAQGPGVG